VAYRETVTRRAQAEGEFSVQRGGKTLYARVVLEVEPLAKEAGFTFTNTVPKGVIPEVYLPMIEASVRESLASGILAGYPLVDLGVTLVGGTYSEEYSTEVAFHSAAAIAFGKATQNAAAVILEPVMSVEVLVPEENTGDVIGDLSARRGEIQGMEPLPGGMQAIRGFVPLAEMFGYATDLRSISQGRGAFSMEFQHYAAVPSDVAHRILGDDASSTGHTVTHKKLKDGDLPE
jgi:elongation factor G